MKCYLTSKTQEFIDRLVAKNAPPLYLLTAENARKVLLNVQMRTHYHLPVDYEDANLAVGPTGNVPIRIVRPRGAQRDLPLVFYVHGGGWIMGNAQTHDRLVCELAIGVQAAVAFPLYTPSPEAQYPVSLEQLYAVLNYLANYGEQFKIDSRKIALIGDSVGGNMATALTFMARERMCPRIDYLFLFYPVVDANFETSSYMQFAKGPWLTKKTMQWFWNAYLPDIDRRREITASPLQATIRQLHGFPSTFLITAENDVLRDEGEAFAQKLRDAGCEITAVRYPGTIHDFVMLNDLAESRPTRAAISQATMMLSSVLHGKP